MSRLLEIGLTGLNAHQRALTTTGHNITNANVEGYSRQEASFATLEPQFRNGVFVGSGVTIDAIRRITDEFLVARSFVDVSRVNELEALDTGLRELDAMLSNEQTGLSKALSELFASLQAVTESPSSLVLREQVLNTSQRYLERFETLVNQVEQIATQIDKALAAQVNQINSITSGIADLNQQISLSSAQPFGSQPNDLLDQRDQLLRDLAQYIGFTTSKDGSNAINVFVGGGQALVLGSRSNELTTISRGGTGNRLDIVLEESGVQRVITDRLGGGQIGGLLQLRESGLDSTLDQLGLLQTQLVASFNSVHTQGVDRNGQPGGNFFTAINDRTLTLNRVSAAPGNSDDSSVVSVTINQPEQLTASQYTLRFSDAAGLLGYEVVRENDGEVVGRGAIPASFPQTISLADGFQIHLESGNFQAGDQFNIRPVYMRAGSTDLLLRSPESLALGVPITTASAAGNLGQGVIEQVEGSSVEPLSEAEQAQIMALRASSPPLVVRFTSPTTYDILDNSNPAQPVGLVPPLRNLPYIPGQSNALLDYDIGSSLYQTTFGFAFSPSIGPVSTVSNGFTGETFTITESDPATGNVTTQTVVALAGESAATVAARLNAVTGIEATANTALSLTIGDDGVGPPLELRLNGVELTSTAIGPVPSPVDADFLAERINTLFAGAGVVASANAGELTVRSLTGEDLTFENFGTGSDTIVVTSLNNAGGGFPVLTGQEVVIAGTLSVITASNTILSSSGGYLTGATALALPAFVGYDLAIAGHPLAGDEFLVTPGSTGTGDNRNALALAGLQSANVLANGTSLSEIYANLVGDVGGKAGAVAVDKAAAESILTRTQERMAEVSGVNLDEEAARLLQYEQAYNASARVISIARSLFDSLLGAFN